MATDPLTGLDAYAGSLSVPGKLTLGGGTAVAKILTASGTLTFAEVASLTGGEQNIAVTGAVAGDACFAAPATGLGNTALAYQCFAATNAVTVRIVNPTLGAITPNAVVWKAVVFQ